MFYWMLTALFIQHDQGFHAHLVTLQHNNDVTIARQTNAVRSRERRARWPPWAEAARASQTQTNTNKLITKQK